jgi:translation initiation factor 1
MRRRPRSSLHGRSLGLGPTNRLLEWALGLVSPPVWLFFAAWRVYNGADMKPRNQPVDYRVVYSTDPSDVIPREGDEAARESAPPPATQTVKMRLEKQGRAGKAVTVVWGFEGSPDELKVIAKDLKAACGAGGTLRLDGGTATIEVQGDQRAKVETRLARLGYRVRRAGG